MKRCVEDTLLLLLITQAWGLDRPEKRPRNEECGHARFLDVTVRSVTRSMQVLQRGVVLSPFNDQYLAG